MVKLIALTSAKTSQQVVGGILKKIVIIIYIVKKNVHLFFLNKKKSKSKLKIGIRGIVVHTILSRMFFFLLR